MASQRVPIDKHQALNRLQALCARSEHCSGDIRRKLQRWGVDANDAEWVLQKLMDDRFVDDVRYAAYFVRDKATFNRWGRLKIATALRAKGIATDIAQAALAELDAEQCTSALAEIMARKLPQIKAKSDYERRAKLIRFGLSRGYEPSDVMATANKLLAYNQFDDNDL